MVAEVGRYGGRGLVICSFQNVGMKPLNNKDAI